MVISKLTTTKIWQQLSEGGPYGYVEEILPATRTTVIYEQRVDLGEFSLSEVIRAIKHFK